MISVTAFKAACTCRWLQLLPDRCTVHLIMELIGSFTVTPANVTIPQERRSTGIRPGTPSFQHLHLWHANHRLQKVGYAYTNDLAIMHADGDWQTVKEVQSKGMTTVGEYLQTWRLKLSTTKAVLVAGLWSRKSRHPTPGNFDYPTPTPTPTFSCISYLKW